MVIPKGIPNKIVVKRNILNVFKENISYLRQYNMDKK